MESPIKLLPIRLKILVGSIFLVLLIIISRLFYLQVNKTLTFYLMGQRNFLRHEKIESPRGNILDCNGKLLVTNSPVTCVNWVGSGNKILNPKEIESIKKLEKILNIEILSNPDLIIANKKKQKLCLKDNLSFEELSQISELFADNPNIVISTSFKRFYPFSKLASHTIGYLGFVDLSRAGRMGIEKTCEDKLKGEPGEIVKTINSVGQSLAEKEIKQAQMGHAIKTTINFDLQLCAESLFPQEHSGAFILLDPKTGAILSLISRPSFDPEIFLRTINYQEWQDLQEKRCFLNRALTSEYPPASLFKLVTMALAIDSKIATLESKWFCCGHIEYGGRTIHCHNKLGHGLVNFKEALEKSCNIPFYDIGKRIKIDNLAHYARELGFGAKTGIIFPESSGLVPTSQWKRKVKGEPWWPGETLSCAIGQSFLLVTPIQIACIVSGICQGYRVTPRILEEEPIITHEINIPKETIKILKKSMKGVVSTHGTAQRLSRLKNIKIYAKTGTAQTSDLSKRVLGGIYLEHGWFVANFKYKDHDPLTMVVFVEHTGSTGPALTMAKDFMINYFNLMDTGKLRPEIIEEFKLKFGEKQIDNLLTST